MSAASGSSPIFRPVDALGSEGIPLEQAPQLTHWAPNPTLHIPREVCEDGPPAKSTSVQHRVKKTYFRPSRAVPKDRATGCQRICEHLKKKKKKKKTSWSRTQTGSRGSTQHETQTEECADGSFLAARMAQLSPGRRLAHRGAPHFTRRALRPHHAAAPAGTQEQCCFLCVHGGQAASCGCSVCKGHTCMSHEPTESETLTAEPETL